MSLDKFGRSSHRSKLRNIQSTIPIFPRTEDGDFDFGNRKLCNVDKPVLDSDSANKNYVDLLISELHSEIKSNIKEFGKLGLTLYELKVKVEKGLENFYTKQQVIEEELKRSFKYFEQELGRSNHQLSSLPEKYYQKEEFDIYSKSHEDKFISFQDRVIEALNILNNKIKQIEEQFSYHANEGENTIGSRTT